GLGSGEAVNELAATGEWEEHQERSDRLIEAIQVIRKLWSGDRINHQGQFYRVAAKLYDLPQQPVPIYVAGAGEHTVHLAGQHADGWITNAASAVKPEFQQALREGARMAKKDP